TDNKSKGTLARRARDGGHQRPRLSFISIGKRRKVLEETTQRRRITCYGIQLAVVGNQQNIPLANNAVGCAIQELHCPGRIADCEAKRDAIESTHRGRPDGGLHWGSQFLLIAGCEYVLRYARGSAGSCVDWLLRGDARIDS